MPPTAMPIFWSVYGRRQAVTACTTTLNAGMGVGTYDRQPLVAIPSLRLMVSLNGALRSEGYSARTALLRDDIFELHSDPRRR